MKIKLILLFAAVSVLSMAYTQTTIPAGNVSGTWSKANSPYQIKGEIIVPKGSTLTLEPGTVLEFQGIFGLTVDGVLNATGKKGDSIVFKTLPKKTWAGILFNRNTQTDTIRFNYCRVENVGFGVRKYKGKEFDFSKLSRATNIGIFCAHSSPVSIKNTRLYFNNKDSAQATQIFVFDGVAIIDSVCMSTSISNGFGTAVIFLDSIRYFNLDHISLSNLQIGYSIGISNSLINNSKLSTFSNYSISNSPNVQSLSFYQSKGVIVRNIYINNSREVKLDDSKIDIRNCLIENSSTGFIGVNNNIGSILRDCIFDNCGHYPINYSPCMRVESSGPLLYNCKIRNSKGDIQVLQDNGPGTPIFLNCTFENATTTVLSIVGYPLVINCNFIGNRSRIKSPAGSNMPPYLSCVAVSKDIYSSYPKFYNCLFWDNADSMGNSNSIVIGDKTVKADLYNCIVQGDSSKGIIGFDYDYTRTTFPLTTSNLLYNKSSGMAPGFIDSAAGNFQLLNTCSQTGYGINKGMSGNLLTQYPFNILKSVYGVDIYNSADLAGNPRVKDDTLDVGCYESSGNKKSLKLQSTYRDTTLCYGASNNYNSKTYGTAQSYDWQYKTGSSIVTVATTPSLSLSNLKTPVSQYRLVVKNNECLPLADSSAWFKVNVNNPLKKGITKNPNKDSIYQNQTMQLSTNATGYQSLLWSTNATTPSISFTGSSLGAPGKYRFSVEGRTIAGCLETDTVYIITKAGNSSINSLVNTANIKLYPQPATDMLNIEIPTGLSSENIMVNISTIEGKSIYNEKLTGTVNVISVGQLEAGIYIITITDTVNQQTIAMKWMKG